VKLYYYKQRWLKCQRKRQILSLFIPIGGGIGLVVLGHEIALIKGEQK
jgi:hypothetical protein